MPTVRVQGTAQLHEVAVVLKRAGRTDLRRELVKGLTEATVDARAKVAASARDLLPHGGGLAAVIAAQKVETKVRLGVRSSNVSVRIVGPHDFRSINRGIVHHPVWGDKTTWVAQEVPSRFFYRPLEALEPKVRIRLKLAMDRVLSKIAD